MSKSENLTQTKKEKCFCKYLSSQNGTAWHFMSFFICMVESQLDVSRTTEIATEQRVFFMKSMTTSRSQPQESRIIIVRVKNKW